VSLTAIIWSLLFVGLTVLSFFRASFGVALYMQAYFMFPDLWWWGKGTPLEGQRWSLVSALIMLAATLFHSVRPVPNGDPDLVRPRKWAILMAINFTLVHIVLSNWDKSFEDYLLQVKLIVMFLVMVSAIRTPLDLRIVLLSIALGATYIGYEVKFNDRGKISGGRLEGVGAPKAPTALPA
jgi:putative inorganic carbon (hco3(-)) transporter